MFIAFVEREDLIDIWNVRNISAVGEDMSGPLPLWHCGV